MSSEPQAAQSHLRDRHLAGFLTGKGGLLTRGRGMGLCFLAVKNGDFTIQRDVEHDSTDSTIQNDVQHWNT